MTTIDVTNFDTTKRAKRLETIWVFAVVVYGIGRSLVVWKVLAKYGVNPLTYFVIDVGSSWLYGIATARLVRSGVHRDGEKAIKWGVLAAITFIAPDVYLVATLSRAPKYLYVVIAVIVVSLGLLAVLGVRRQLLSNRNTGVSA
jgi:hypothetical protein